MQVIRRHEPDTQRQLEALMIVLRSRSVVEMNPSPHIEGDEGQRDDLLRQVIQANGQPGSPDHTLARGSHARD